MLFSVIYSVDIPKPELFCRGSYAATSINAVKPPKTKRGTWQRTEHSRSPMSGEPDKYHGKWCAILDKAQFIEFVRHCDLTASSVETMGSIGAPGFGFGCAPAISFDNDPSAGYWGNAYVTPLPCNRKGEPIRKSGATERDWDRIKARIVQVLG
jgi:hypothetical protein